MKRFVKIFIVFVLVFMMLTPIVAFATEVAEVGGAETNHTIFTRLWDFVQNNTSEVVSGAGSFLILVVSGIIKVSNAKGTKKLEESLSMLHGEAADTTKAQGSIINVVNQMISGANSMSEKVEEMYRAYQDNQTIENDRNRLLGAMMVEVTAILEMQAAVYVHNKNLPQGVKDLAILKYTNAQKALSDDELLCAIVQSVREKINFEAVEETAAVEEAEEEAVI